MTRRYRLHVNKIVSVGAVEAGDNEPARIMFWKRRKSATERPAGSVVTPVSAAPGRGRALAEAVTKRQNEHSQAIAELGASYKTIRTDIDELRGNRTVATKQRTSAEVLAEVNAMAKAIKKSAGEPLTMAAARTEVWKVHPELMAEERQAKKREKAYDSVADEPSKTVGDRVREVIDEATRRASWQPLMERWGDGQTRDQIIAKVRVEVWRSPDGRELRDLDRAFGTEPYTPAATGEIRKSRSGTRLSRALNLLDSGIWEQ